MSSLIEFLETYPPETQQLVQDARLAVLQALPGAHEQVDFPSRLLAYGFGKHMKDMVCVIMPLKHGINLGFYNGVDLPDPAGLLSGTGKRHRHVRIDSPVRLQEPALLELLAQAMLAWQKRSSRGESA